MRFLACVAALSIAGMAEAKTVDVTYGDCPETRVEQLSTEVWQVKRCGFKFLTSDSYEEDAITLHDDYGGAAQSVVSNMNGFRFDLLTADVRAWSNAYMSGSEPGDDYNDVPGFTHNIGIYGYRGGAVVASLEYFQRDFDDPKTLTFGSDFTGLDTLIFRMFVPKGDAFLIDFDPEFETVPRNTLWCALYYCGGVSVGSLKVEVSDWAPATVPLPAGLPLLATALAALAARRAWRR